jgi:radical SAM superfamily enzyme
MKSKLYVSSESIKKFLLLMTKQTLTNDEFEKILKTLTPDNYISDAVEVMEEICKKYV